MQECDGSVVPDHDVVDFMDVHIHGPGLMRVCLSHGNFANVNVLGVDFCEQHKLNSIINYRENKFLLSRDR